MKYTLITLLISAFILSMQIQTQEPTEEQNAMLESLPPDQREAIKTKMLQGNKISEDIEETFKMQSNLIERPEISKDIISDCEDCIYGYDIFRFSPTTFAPFDQVPVSSQYILGPGDKLIISIFGSEQIRSEQFLDRNGIFDIPKLGPISLAGLTITQAKELLSNIVKRDLIG